MLGFETEPRAMDRDGRALKKAAAWPRENGYDSREIRHSHVWFRFFMPEKRRERGKHYSPEILPRGTILVWDSHYSRRKGRDLNALRRDRRRWKLLRAFDRGPVFIFEKRMD
jgi:hypothetical protein